MAATARRCNGRWTSPSTPSPCSPSTRTATDIAGRRSSVRLNLGIGAVQYFERLFIRYVTDLEMSTQDIFVSTWRPSTLTNASKERGKRRRARGSRTTGGAARRFVGWRTLEADARERWPGHHVRRRATRHRRRHHPSLRLAMPCAGWLAAETCGRYLAGSSALWERSRTRWPSVQAASGRRKRALT